MDSEFVLVIGAAVLEISGETAQSPQPGTRQFGRVRHSVSGVARNIAENLARLDIKTMLLSSVADDDIGQHIITHSSRAGIDCSHILRVSGAHTAASITLGAADERGALTVDDFSIMQYLDSDYLLEHEHLFQKASLVVIDATLSAEALDTLFELAARHQAPVCADPTSPLLAGRLCSYIPNLYLIVPNASETVALCGLEKPADERESAIQIAWQLVNMGANIAVVTLGEQGLAYADTSGGGYIRAIHTQVVHAAGAGDAFSGAVIFGILNSVPIDEAMRLGVTAASLTLASEARVLPTLSQELLYDELVM